MSRINAPENDAEYQRMVDAKIARNKGWVPDTGNEMAAIQASNEALNALKTKSFSWLKSNATSQSGLRTFWKNNCTWGDIVNHELGFNLPQQVSGGYKKRRSLRTRRNKKRRTIRKRKTK